MSVRFTAQLRAEGLGAPEIRRLVRDQKLIQLRRGAYSAVLLNGVERHLQLIAATLPMLVGGAVVSHYSAAVLHELPVRTNMLDRVTFTRPDGGGGCVHPHLHRYRTPLADGDVEAADGITRTTLARTVIDLARCGELPMAVAAADRALRVGLARESLDAQLNAAKRRRGVARARTAVTLADGRSESAG